MTAKEPLPHVTTWDISQVPFLPRIPPLPFLSSREKRNRPVMPADSPLRVLHCLLGQLGISFNTFRWSGWNTDSTCFPKEKEKKTVIKWSIVVRRDVLVESNLLGEKCQTIYQLRNYTSLGGIEHFWNKFGEIISFKELENIQKISRSSSRKKDRNIEKLFLLHRS